MKKITTILLGVLLAFSLVACGNSQSTEVTAPPADVSMEETEETEDTTIEEATAVREGKTLVVYFSRSGNTESIAKHIQERTGGDLYEIVPANPYPEDYDECVEIAETEKNENARPEIAELPEDISEYSTILIGYPIWWHTAPMVIGTFLENYDLTGVDIHPFSQSGTMNEEQFAESLAFVTESAGNGTVHEGIFAEEEDTDVIDAYLEANGLSQ